MGRIENLRQDLLTMTHEEKLERIRQIRTERKIVRNPIKEKAIVRAAKKGSAALIKQLQGYSEEQLRELGLI